MTTTSAPTSTGSVATSGSTTYIQSSASGLDTNSLIDAAVAQKTARADTLDAEVTANKAKISAYQTLQGLLNQVSTSMTALAGSTYTSSTTASGNDFDAKQATVAASDGGSAASILAASAQANAQPGVYSIQVQQLAKAMKVAATAQPPSTALGLSGTFTVGTAGGQSATVAVTAGMTLSDVAAAISAQSATTGVNATLINLGSGQSQLVLSGAQTAATIQASAASGDDVLRSLGLTAADGSFKSVIQQPQSAIVSIDGAQVVSPTNELDNAIPGVSMSLLNATAPGAALTLTVQTNYSQVKTSITDFVAAYNNLRDFLSTQETVNADGSVPSTSVLFADTLLRNLGGLMSGALTGASGSASGAIGRLSDLGVTFDSNNKLTVSDETALDNALLSDTASVQSFFETSFTTSNSALKLLQNTSTSSLSFTMDVAVDASGAITGVTVGGQSGLFTVSGARIVGAPNTPYAGLSFALVASASTSIAVNLRQGFANQMANLATQFGDANTGLVQSQINNLGSLDKDLSSQSSDIRTAADAYRTQLIDKYSKMETEVQASKLLQQQIQAILGASTSSNG
ncbi:MAG: flagellar filament capping protein FliD [Caulobacteraceae bacterium]|nr:flagellar filament capping protein FliD [Caulobacteraceae bacterium]